MVKRKIAYILVVMCFLLLLTGCRDKEKVLRCTIDKHQPIVEKERTDVLELRWEKNKFLGGEEVVMIVYEDEEFANAMYRTLRRDTVFKYTIEGNRLTGVKEFVPVSDNKPTYDEMREMYESDGWTCE